MSANFPSEEDEETLSQPSDFSNRALVRIRTHGLTLTPEMFNLWYAYYAGTSADITRAIDILVASGQEITDLRCAEIVESVLENEKDCNVGISEAGEKVRDTIQSIGKAVCDMSDASAKYKKHLTKASSEIGMSGSKPSDVKNILQDLLVKTQKMAESGAALDEVLEYSSGTIDELQKAMTDAHQEAVTDSLTGIANRKAFDARLDSLILGDDLEDGQDKAGFCLIMLDIDHFKTFNDDYGHQVGDHVLRLVANTLVDGIKGRDVAARYGGEEFAVLLPSTAAKGGMIVANALIRAVGDKDLVNRTTGEKLGQITLSAGVSSYKEGTCAQDLIKLADEALYKAKCEGRDRVVMAN